MTELKNKKGFTLVEIVIVLAIAALILAGIFLAVQGAARGQRDQDRRDAVARLVANVQQLAGNNNGTLPGACGAVGGAQTGWTAGAFTCNGGAVSITNLTYTTGQDCNGASAVPRVFRIDVTLEQGTNYCQDNN